MSRSLRSWLAGQAISLTGTWITRVATGYLVWRLTGSAAALGAVVFAGQLPSLLLSAPAGALVDRWDVRRILIATQALSALQSAALAAMALGGCMTPGVLIALAAFQGVINALDMPARQSLLARLGREDLLAAIGMSSTVVHATRLAGPLLAGVLIASVGEGWCFAIDAASYLGPVLALRSCPAMPAREGRAARFTRPGLAGEVLEGLRWVHGSQQARDVLVLLALVSTLGMPHAALLPAIGTDPTSLGLLTGASGAGALAGALWLGRRRAGAVPERLLGGAALAAGAGLIALAAARGLWPAAAALVVVGAGLMVVVAASGALLQAAVDDGRRGRVMSLHTMAFFGAAPLGSWIAGALADRIGAAPVIGAGGALCVAGAAWFRSRSPAFRPARPRLLPGGPCPAQGGRAL